MIRVAFRPLPVWPYPDTLTRRGPATFRAGWRNTLDLLDRELWNLGASAVMLAARFREQDLRLDGWPKSDARWPDHPGVELSFDTVDLGRLVYATDVCSRWDHNVRSIALGLEALRAVDRFGITRRGEQYAGWKALPGAVDGDRAMTANDAWVALARFAGQDFEPVGAQRTDELARRLYRVAAKNTHPDAGGSDENFRRVQRAADVLGVG